MPSTPTMAAMPMLMPSADSAARTRRLRSPRLPTRSRSRRGQPGAAGVVGHGAGRRVTDDPPVADLDAPVHGGGDVEVVGDDHDGGAVAVQLAQQLQDRRPGGGVEVAGGLVGHHQRGPAGQGPGDGGALLLAAGQLVGPVPEPVAEPDPLERRLRPAGGARRAGAPR